jgi:hypothetical protein
MRTNIGGSRLCVDGELYWHFGIHSSDMRVGTSPQEKFNILPFRVKIQGLALTGCVW